MNKSALWTVVVVIIVVFAMGAFVMIAHNSAGSPTGSAVSSSAIVSYVCDDQRIIAAEFSSSSITMALSDGRSFVLPQIATASGTRYEEGASTGQDIVFMNNGAGADFIENGSTTYRNCVVHASPPAQ
jgi:membrane-bound inhibitor of C-type lysozyme